MKTFIIKKEHLDNDNYYIGSEDLSDYKGQIESQGGLGFVRFKTSLRAKFSIIMKEGDSVTSECSIIAGGFIRIGGDIIARDNIESVEYIKAEGFIKAGGFIKTEKFIESRGFIKTGEYIESRGAL